MTSTPARPSPSTFQDGLRATLPLVPGIVAFGLVYGVMARQAGLSLSATVAMSALVFAGASQFTAVSMWGQASGGLIILTTFIINLRHLPMGASLAPYLRRESRWCKALLGFGTVDEGYALAISRYLEGDGSRAFFFGVSLVLYASWVLSAGAGGMLGGQTLDPARWGIALVFPLTFLGLLMPLCRERVTIIVAAASGIVAVATAPWLPGKGNILVAMLVGGLLGALLEARWATTE